MSKIKTFLSKTRPTSHDVARVAGVSQSSVSLVFTNASGSRVSAATRERILKAARALGYQPDHIARALRKGYSNEIALLIWESVAAPLYAELLSSTWERARELGYSLAIYPFYDLSPKARRSLFESVVARHPVGIIGGLVMTQADWRLARKMGIYVYPPTRFRNGILPPLFLSSVKQAFYLGAKHLFERGHKHIALATPRAPTRREESLSGPILDALRSAAGEMGGTVTELPMHLAFADACAAIDVLLSSPSHPTGILGYTDGYCLSLLNALSARGVRVPQDIALVGVNDSPICTLTHPTLTSVRYDVEATSVNSVEAIDAMIHEKQPDPDLLAVPPPQLIVRESS